MTPGWTQLAFPGWGKPQTPLRPGPRRKRTEGSAAEVAVCGRDVQVTLDGGDTVYTVSARSRAGARALADYEATTLRRGGCADLTVLFVEEGNDDNV